MDPFLSTDKNHNSSKVVISEQVSKNDSENKYESLFKLNSYQALATFFSKIFIAYCYILNVYFRNFRKKLKYTNHSIL